jgi:ribosomal protein S26
MNYYSFNIIALIIIFLMLAIQTLYSSPITPVLIHEIDECKIYRFYDMTKYHYFVKCNHHA